MSVITLSRQLGSLGFEIGEEVGRRLGYAVIGRDLINQAARRAGAPEVALDMIDELGLLGVKPSTAARRAYVAAVRQVMEELAGGEHVVIIGRGGQVILHDWPGALHVRVIAPAALRAERVAQRHGIGLLAAQAQVEASDRHRQNFLRLYLQAAIEDSNFYHLILNTAYFSVEQAASLIVCAVKGCIPS